MNNGEHPTRLAYRLPNTELPNKEWDEILANNSAINQFKVLNTGAVKVPRSGMLNTDKLVEESNLNQTIWVDVFVFMFHHQDKGWFIIDTGLDNTFQHEGNIDGLLASNYIMDSKQNPGQNIGAQLSRVHKEIQGIFFTHLHGDHTAGMPEIDRSIPKYVGKKMNTQTSLFYISLTTYPLTQFSMNWTGLKEQVRLPLIM